MSNRRDTRQLLATLAELPGWTVTQGRRSSHYRIQPPDGRVAFTGSTPGDRRSVLNLRAQLLRRIGAPV